MAILGRCSAAPSGDAVKLAAPEHIPHTVVADGRVVLGFPDLSTDFAASADQLLDGSMRVRGDWTFLAAGEQEIAIRTDGYGSHPLFVRAGGGSGLVAEEVWPLVSRESALDAFGLTDFLLVGLHLGRRTVFEEVSATESDAIVRVRPDGVNTKLLPSVAPVPVDESLEHASAALEGQLDRIYEPYLQVERLLIPLSGGLDSRVLLALALEQGFDVHAWTYALVHGSQEERLARRVAASLGVPHSVSNVTTTHLLKHASQFVRATSGQLSLEHMHAYGTHHDLPGEYSVAVNGIWGDAICGGSYLIPAGTPASEIERIQITRLLGGRDPAVLQERLPGIPGWTDRVRELVSTWYATVNREPRLADFIHIRNRATRFNVYGSIVLRDQLQYILPFLDDDLIRTSYGMSEAWQRDAIAYRHVVQRRWPELAAIPWEKTGLPLGRSPGRLRRKIRNARRRFPLGRPIAFSDFRVQYRAFSELIERAVPSLTPVLLERGIDLRGLLDDYPPNTYHGRGLRLRAATLYLALREAGHSAVQG